MPVSIRVGILLTCCWWSQLGLAQSRSELNLRLADTPLREVFGVLEKQFGVVFSFDHATVDPIRLSKKIKASNLEQALVQLFQGTGLAYQVVDRRQVMVRPANDLSNQPPAQVPPQQRQVSGVVFDQFNQKPLPFAHVLSGQGGGAITDEEGRFSFALPDHRAVTELEVQYLGYQTKALYLQPGLEPVELIFRLTPKVELLKTFTVTDHAPLVSPVPAVSALRVPARALQVAAAPQGPDLLRSIQLLPGIAAFDDLSAELNVRGSTGDETLIILDGIPLYNVTHYFGVFSLINSNIVREATLHKNAFPAEFGGRNAAVLDVKTLAGSEPRLDVQVNLNLLTADAVVETALGKSMRFLAAGRITTQNLSNAEIFSALNQEATTSPAANTGQDRLRAPVRRELVAQQPDFRFNDVNAKWTWTPSATAKVQASFFQGRDAFDYAYNERVIPPSRRPLPDSLLPQRTAYTETADWENRGASVQYHQQWNSRVFSNLTLAHSSYTTNREILNTDTRLVIMRRDTTQRTRTYLNRHFNQLQGWDLHWNNQWKMPSGATLDLGYQLAHNAVDYQVIEDNRTVLGGEGRAPQHAIYSQLGTAGTTGPLDLNLGLRLTAFNQAWYLSPRLSATLGQDEVFQGKAGWAVYQQFLYQLNHEDRYGRSFLYWIMANRQFPVSIAHQYMLGFIHRNRWFKLDVEVYQKDLQGVVEQAQNQTGLALVNGRFLPRNFTLFNGTGQTRGIDVLIEKSTPHYSGWLAYTLSKTTQSFPQINRNQPFLAPLDRRHQLKWINQVQLGDWELGGSWIYASGRPYTDLSKTPTTQGEREQISASDRQSTLEAYSRTDLWVQYRFKIGRSQCQVGGSIFNLFDRENVKYRQFIYAVPTQENTGIIQRPPVNTVVGTEFQMLDLTATVNVNVRF